MYKANIKPFINPVVNRLSNEFTLYHRVFGWLPLKLNR